MRASPKFSIEVGNRFGVVLPKGGGDDNGDRFVNRALRGFLFLFLGAYRTIGTNHLGGCCRFEPSCSEYAVEALHQHGPFSAIRLIFVRVMRCRPGKSWGYDPVPLQKQTRGVS